MAQGPFQAKRLLRSAGKQIITCNHQAAWKIGPPIVRGSIQRAYSLKIAGRPPRPGRETVSAHPEIKES